MLWIYHTSIYQQRLELLSSQLESTMSDRQNRKKQLAALDALENRW